MNRLKEFTIHLLAYLCNLLLVSFLLALFFFPYGEVSDHRYLFFKMYNLVIHLASSLFNQFLLITGITVFFIFILKRLIQSNFREKLKEDKGRISLGFWKLLLYLLTMAVIYSVLLVSSLLLLKDQFRVSLASGSFEIFLAIFTLGLFVLFFFLKPRELIRNKYYKIASTMVVVIFVLINLVSYLGDTREGPNVVLISISSFRADMAADGMNNKKNLSSLAELKEDAIFFSNFWANSSRTLPSLAAIFTSQYPSKLNLTDHHCPVSAGVLTLPELLKNEGYRTFGVAADLFLNRKYGLAQGFDRYRDRIRTGENYNLFTSTSAAISQAALQCLDEAGDKKFFLFIHYDDPDLPYNPGNGDYDFSYHGDFAYGASLDKIFKLIGDQKYTQDDIYYLKRCHGREIVRVDRHIGLLIRELKKKKLYDNTLIIVTACHGEEFMERGFLGHGTSVYNEQLAIPLLMKLPLSVQKKPALAALEVKTPFSLVDLLPTITSLLAIGNPQNVQGEDILNNLDKGTAIFGEINNPYLRGRRYDALTLIKDNFKLIYFPDTRLSALYDLSQDTFEALDISRKEPKRMEEMRKQLDRWILVNRGEKSSPEKIGFTPEERKALTSLGYRIP